MEGTARNDEVACTLVYETLDVFVRCLVGTVGGGWTFILGGRRAVHGCIESVCEVGQGGLVVGGDDICSRAWCKRHAVSKVRPVAEEDGMQHGVWDISI